MEHLKFQYKKFWESGALQEPYIGFIRPFKNSSFHCHNPDSLKVITRLRLIHKFKNSFEDTLNPIYNCDTVETTIHYLLRCPNFSKEKLTLQQTSKNWWKYFKSNISKVLLFGDHSFNVVKNTSVLNASIEYIISTKRFDVPFYQNWHFLIFVKKLLFH